VLVPKTAMHEDDGAMLWKHDIRIARQICAMQTEAKTEAMQQLTDSDLGLRILLPDAPHDARARFR